MLSDLAHALSGSRVIGNSGTRIKGVSVDSRCVEGGDLFIALKGAKSDGQKFIQDAISRGAVAIASGESLSVPVPMLMIPEPRKMVGVIASKVYGDPTQRMIVVGVTGTNGKTTTAHLVEWMLSRAGLEAGYIGTTAYRWKGKDTDAPRTTPEAAELQKMFRKMADAGVKAAAVECSSHGIEMGRLNGVHLDVAVFTNLTPEHLDYHVDMERYREAKWKLFSEILEGSSKSRRVAAINMDDSVGREWISKVKFPCVSFSLQDSKATVFARNIRADASEIQAEVCVEGSVYPIRSPLIGRHNLSNILAAIAVGKALELDLAAVVAALQCAPAVPGRLERVENDRGLHVFVDYAHKDDALRNVLEALKPLRTRRMIVVFGCGGDRDRAKRPRMAAVATGMADVTIITSDNPRSENPETIVGEIIKGISGETKQISSAQLNDDSRNTASVVVDRKEAIELAIQIARSGDIVLIAGKGHETYQEIQGKCLPFDDRVVARRFLSKGAP